MRASIILIILLSLNFTEPTHAEDEKQIRRDCTADALRYCKAAIASGSRDIIIACMVANRDKLRPRCAAHIY